MSALRASVWAPPIGIAAIILLAVAMLDIEASARGMGGGARGVGGRGVSFGRGFGGASFSRGGPGFSHSIGRSAAVNSFSAPHGGRASIGSRSFSGNRFAGRTTTTGSFSRAANVTRAHQVFGNRVITNAAFHSAHVPFRFQGRFFGSPWPWWWGGIVIGWVGPVFWPYAYYDFFDYVFWPYAYDDFWPYAYDDVYYGLYGNYAYVDPGARAGRPRTSRANGSGQRVVGVCGENAPELTNFPIERISEVVEPTEAQRAALDELKGATAKAIDILKTACPNDLPSIATGRLAAMESRLQVMLQAVQTVRPPLDRFYQSLSDEQKARFNAVAPTDTSSAVQKDQRDLTRLCTEQGPGIADLPIDRIAKAVQPTDAQRAALDELKAASAKAGEGLKVNCPTYRALTSTGRVEAMQQRLEAMLEAVKTVQPALAKFYGGLNDEQKARFNPLGATRTGT